MTSKNKKMYLKQPRTILNPNQNKINHNKMTNKIKLNHRIQIKMKIKSYQKTNDQNEFNFIYFMHFNRKFFYFDQDLNIKMQIKQIARNMHNLVDIFLKIRKKYFYGLILIREWCNRKLYGRKFEFKAYFIYM